MSSSLEGGRACSRSWGLARLALVSVILLVLAVCTALAHGSSSVPKFVVVPIYYLTDRNLEGDTFGRRRRYQSNCLHRMFYGTAFVTVENSNHETPGRLFDGLGWKATDDHPKTIAPKDQIDPSRPRLGKRAFAALLKNALDQAGTDKLCVYLHGAGESFEDACQDAAELAYCLRRPLVLYSWPSEPKLLDYVVDNGNSEWSQGHFNLFCRDLAAFKEMHPLRLILLAHSMGNRFIFRSIHFLYHEKLVSDCELISPDIDIDTCRHYLMGFRRVDNNTAIRLYVSKKDKMLRLSQKLFGGYARLGEDVQSNIVPSRGVQHLTIRKKAAQKEEKSNLSEADYAEQPDQSESTDTPEETTGADVLERIDFTAVDKGFTGHSIPFQLVANMVNGNEPGQGLELVQDQADKLNSHLKVVRTSPPGPSTPQR